MKNGSRSTVKHSKEGSNSAELCFFGLSGNFALVAEKKERELGSSREGRGSGWGPQSFI
jgi:hypothetical protein